MTDKAYMMKSPVDLGKKVPELPKDATFDPVSSAEQALVDIEQDFGKWMNVETDRLIAAWQDISAKGMIPDRREVLYGASHDIKGEAATFGYPLAGEIADHLCRLLDTNTDAGNLPLDVIENHVLAIQAVVREDARGDDHHVGRELVAELKGLVDDFIAERHK